MSRWPISSIRLPRPLPLWRGDQMARRGRPRSMSIHSTLKPSGSNSGADHLADRFDPREVQRAAVLVDPSLEHRDGPLLLGIDGADHASARPGCSWAAAGVAERSEGRRARQESGFMAELSATSPLPSCEVSDPASAADHARAYELMVHIAFLQQTNMVTTIATREREARRGQQGHGRRPLIDALIEREGGYVNHPADRGGPTCFGITEAVARAHGYRGAMRQLPRDEAVAIYRRLVLAAAALRRGRQAQRRASPPSCSTPAPTWGRRSPRPSSSAR